MLRINHCFNAKIIAICQKSLQIDDLNLKLNRFLPNDLKPYCKVGGFKNGCLTIQVTESIWATNLRFLLPELRDNLRHKLHQLATIKIDIKTGMTLTDKTIKKSAKLHLTDSAKNIISKSAESFNYQPLKNALLNLAKQDK